MTTKRNAAILVAVGLLTQVVPLSLSPAATTTSTFVVQATVAANCAVSSASPINFGNSVGVLNAIVDQTGSVSVICTNSTTYNVGLNAGTGSGATVATRKMTGPASAVINYTLYQDSGRTTVWGDTVGTDTGATKTGNGAAQAYTVYGRIPVQTSPAPGAYTDTITVTVTY